jgi:diacylglycerol kinase family enzyme
LARNLGVPVAGLEQAMVVALTGRNTTIDVGCVQIDRTGADETPEVDNFLVMAGLGADSSVMADADDRLKAQLGTGAYVVAGLRNMYGPQFKVAVSVDGGLEFTRRTRSMLVGNCGRLFGGLALMPDALVDDGRLDAVILSPKGVVGWAAVAAAAATRQRRGHPLMDRHTGERMRIRADRAQQVQLDGDLMGQARVLTAWVQPRALVVRVTP